MREQEVRELYEAYLEVYEQIVPDPMNNRPIGTPRVNPDSMKQYGEFKNLPDWRMRNLIKDINYGQQVKKQTPKITTQVAHLDLFDLIKGHLLDEGYADTNEAALAIMTNMSEEWRQSIVEDIAGNQYKPNPIGNAIKSGAGLIKRVLGNLPSSSSSSGTSTKPGDGKPYQDGPLWDGPKTPTKPPTQKGPANREEPLW